MPLPVPKVFPPLAPPVQLDLTGLHGRKFYATLEAAVLLGLKGQTLRKWRHRGVGPRYFRLGTGTAARVVYSEEDILAWLRSRSFGSTSEETVASAASGRSR